VLFDRRGVGASDRFAGGGVPSWLDSADDLMAVLDAVASTRAVVFAVMDAGPPALLVAATHPDRIEGMILARTAARLLPGDDYPYGYAPAQWESVLDDLQSGWGNLQWAQRQWPEGTDPRFVEWSLRYMRASCTPRMARALMEAWATVDARPLLEQVAVPTLVVSRADELVPVEHAHYLAAHLADATFIEVPGKGGLLNTVRCMMEPLRTFVAKGRRAEPSSASTVVFTDVVDSTRQAVEIGDLEWHRLLDAHDRVTREIVSEHGGSVIKSTGDGALILFKMPEAALAAVRGLQATLSTVDLTIRAGVHLGEVIFRGDDIGGATVHAAARVAALASPGPEVVAEKVGASDAFGSSLQVELKGLPGQWNIRRLGVPPAANERHRG
jgi:class 3 adenylate cyclase